MSINNNYTSEDLHNHLMHAKGKAREDHKYISREWKNGRWQYTYEGDSSSRSAKTEAVIKDSGRTTASNSTTGVPKVSKEYLEEVAYNSKKNSFSTKTTTDVKKNVATGKSTVADLTKGSSEYEAEKAYNSQKNVYPTNQSTDTKTQEKKQSWIDRVKDKLGVDERASYLEAKSKYELASEKRQDADREADAAIENYTNGDNSKKASEWLHEAVSSHTHWKERAYERGKEYMSAKTKYMKTPMGVFLKAGEAISDAAFDVSYAVEKAVDKTKEAVKDAAHDVEYTVKRDTGISAKKEYDNAEYAVKAAEEQLKKAKQNHNSSAEYMAEFYLDQAEKRYEKAKKAYEGTPAHAIESGIEWIKGLFDKKKRN